MALNSVKIHVASYKVCNYLNEEYFTVFIFKIYSQGLADNIVIAKVNGVLWDLDRPFENNAELKLLKFDDDEGLLIVKQFLKLLST